MLIARALLVAGSLWPALWPALAIVGAFVTAALFGLIATLPVWLHWIGLAATGGGIVWALWKGLREFHWPDRRAALRLIEETNGLTHQPLSAFEDIPAEGTGDPALWSAHRLWASLRLKKLRVGLPRPHPSALDRYGIGTALLLVLVIAIFGTAEGGLHRLTNSFFPGLEASRKFALEAWITPPPYTGQPPVYLERPDWAERTLRVPENSVISLRTHGLRSAPELEIAEQGRERPRELRDIGEGNYAIDAPITASSNLVLTQGGRMIRHWQVEIIPDAPPMIAFDKTPTKSVSGALRFTYKMSDDYGVASAEARMTLIAPPKGTGAPRGKEPAARVSPPKVSLTTAPSRGKEGKAETYSDLSAHPWAGLSVNVTLVARDDAGQESSSAPMTVILPAREFNDPLARAIIEQRQRLAFDPYSGPSVARFLDAFMQEPERYLPDPVVYLALRSAYWRLRLAERDQDLTGIYDLLWATALRLEDGDMSLSENDLRAARDALKDALARGASEEEIENLLSNLQNAFQRFMDALETKFGPMNKDEMEQAWNTGNDQTVERSDLENMMKMIGELARTGAREQAEAMLSQLQTILENMRLPNQPQQMSPSDQAASEAIEQMGKLIGEQSQLMDESFKQAQPHAKFDEKALKELRKNQAELRKQLSELAAKLKEKGASVPQELGQATEAMGSAEERLGEGRADRASTAQGQAIDHMRKGAQAMADKLMEGSSGKPGSASKGMKTDPFGRPMPGGAMDAGADVRVPDKMDVQKARGILQELRRRASEAGRPKSEIDYLDRLLKRF